MHGRLPAVEQLAPGRYGLVRHVIGERFLAGMSGRDRRVGEGVSAHDQTVATGKFERNVTLCVARRIDDAKAGDNFIPGLDHFHLFLMAA